MRHLTNFFLLALCLGSLAPTAKAGNRGLTFYLNWDAKAASECAKAVTRIEKPYVTLDTGLLLQEERGESGMFDQLFFGTRKSSRALRAMNQFPSFQEPSTKRLLKQRLEETPNTVKLSYYLPPVVLSIAVNENDSEANCFGAAMGWFGFHNSLYSLTAENFEELLKEEFSRIKPGAQMMPETLVVWRYPKSHQPGLIHAAILLDRDVIWHRPGHTPAGFSTFARALNRYGGRNGGNDDAVISFHQRKLLKPIAE